jgi:hypothetical protein
MFRSRGQFNHNSRAMNVRHNACSATRILTQGSADWTHQLLISPFCYLYNRLSTFYVCLTIMHTFTQPLCVVLSVPFRKGATRILTELNFSWRDHLFVWISFCYSQLFSNHMFYQLSSTDNFSQSFIFACLFICVIDCVPASVCSSVCITTKHSFMQSLSVFLSVHFDRSATHILTHELLTNTTQLYGNICSSPSLYWKCVASYSWAPFFYLSSIFRQISLYLWCSR